MLEKEAEKKKQEKGKICSVKNVITDTAQVKYDCSINSSLFRSEACFSFNNSMQDLDTFDFVFEHIY